MHNVNVLVKGKTRCTLQVQPRRRRRLGLTDGGSAHRRRVGSVVAPVEVTATILPGVVSLPHGWGHDQPGTQMRWPPPMPGSTRNVLTDGAIDPLSGNAVLNGIPVEVSPR